MVDRSSRPNRQPTRTPPPVGYGQRLSYSVGFGPALRTHALFQAASTDENPGGIS
jgi:hypothetical protein